MRYDEVKGFWREMDNFDRLKALNRIQQGIKKAVHEGDIHEIESGLNWIGHYFGKETKNKLRGQLNLVCNKQMEKEKE